MLYEAIEELFSLSSVTEYEDDFKAMGMAGSLYAQIRCFLDS